MRWAIRNAWRAVVVGVLLQYQRVTEMGCWAKTFRPTLFSAGDLAGCFALEPFGTTNLKGLKIWVPGKNMFLAFDGLL